MAFTDTNRAYSLALTGAIRRLQGQYGRPAKRADETIAGHQHRVRAWEGASGYREALDAEARALQDQHGFERRAGGLWHPEQEAR